MKFLSCLSIAGLKPVTRKEEILVEEEKFPDLKVGWFAFAKGLFSENADAFDNLLGVVAWVNPDKQAPSGQRALIVTPHETHQIYSSVYQLTEIRDKLDGKTNTEKLLQYGKMHQVSFPAAEWCAAVGAKADVQSFLPSIVQCKRMVANCSDVNQSLELVGGDIIDGMLLSSTEYGIFNVWVVDSNFGRADYWFKGDSFTVRSVIAV